MKKWIDSYLNNKIEKYLKKRERGVEGINNGYSITIGKYSQIDNPFKIENGANIYVGDNSYVGKHGWLATHLHLNSNPLIVIKNNVTIGNYAHITAVDKIEISSGVLISEYVYISDHTHGFEPTLNVIPLNQNLTTKGQVFIGENCFIGYRVSILPNVTIGKNCVVGAHSVVTKDIPDYCMVAGIPAIVIKKFNFTTNKWENIDKS